jgi:hypothetical protein
LTLFKHGLWFLFRRVLLAIFNLLEEILDPNID